MRVRTVAPPILREIARPRRACGRLFGHVKRMSGPRIFFIFAAYTLWNSRSWARRHFRGRVGRLVVISRLCNSQTHDAKIEQCNQSDSFPVRAARVGHFAYAAATLRRDCSMMPKCSSVRS